MNINEATELLIKEVQKRPILWNTDVEQKKKGSRDKRAIAWMEVSNALGISDLALKPKWKNLRDMFRREHMKLLSKEKIEPRWKYYNMLKFLLTENFKFSEKCTDNSLDNEEAGEEEIENYDHELGTDTETFDYSENPIEDCFIKTESGDHRESSKFGYVVEIANERKSSKRKMQEEDDTDYDLLYLKSLVPYFKELEPMRKLIVRSRIQDILMSELARAEHRGEGDLPSSSSRH